MPDFSLRNHTEKKPSYRCLAIIIDSSIRQRLTEFLEDAGVLIFYQMHGVGTVSSEFLNLCGLGDTHKTILLCFVPRHRAKAVLTDMNHALQLHKRGTGIAVSIPMNGMQGWLYKLLHFAEAEAGEQEQENENEVKKMSDTITHAMILAAINQGYSDDVMATARAAGATGGTILKGLRCAPAEVASRFGIPLQDEQEIVLIVVPKDKKVEMMTAISEAHGISTPAHGVVLSLPVDGIMGL